MDTVLSILIEHGYNAINPCSNCVEIIGNDNRSIIARFILSDGKLRFTLGLNPSKELQPLTRTNLLTVARLATVLYQTSKENR